MELTCEQCGAGFQQSIGRPRRWCEDCVPRDDPSAYGRRWRELNPDKLQTYKLRRTRPPRALTGLKRPVEDLAAEVGCDLEWLRGMVAHWDLRVEDRDGELVMDTAYRPWLTLHWAAGERRAA